MTAQAGEYGENACDKASGSDDGDVGTARDAEHRYREQERHEPARVFRWAEKQADAQRGHARWIEQCIDVVEGESLTRTEKPPGRDASCCHQRESDQRSARAQRS